MIDTPILYGSPLEGRVLNRASFIKALRENDRKALDGMDHDGSVPDVMYGGETAVLPGIRTNRFNGIATYMRAGAERIWASGRACQLVADRVSGAKIEVQRQGKVVEKLPPDLTRLLSHPNPHETMREMLWILTHHLKLAGVGYWFMDSMNLKGRPDAIYWLNPAFVKIKPHAQKRIAGYVYMVNGKEIDLEPEEIIHFRRPSIMSSILGASEIQQGENLYDEFINRALYNEAYMENGGAPGSVLVYDGDADDTEFAMKRAKFMEKYGGVKNAGKQPWLQGKWSLLTLGMSAQAMQDLEKYKQNVEDIFHNHGVPLSVAGYQSANYATAQVEERNFIKYTCVPQLGMILDKLNHPEHGLLRLWDENLRLEPTWDGAVDIEALVKQYAPLVEVGAMQPYELRKICNLPEDENPYLKQYFVKSNLIPIEVAGIANETPVGVQQDQENDKAKRKPGKPVGDEPVEGEEE